MLAVVQEAYQFRCNTDNHFYTCHICRSLLKLVSLQLVVTQEVEPFCSNTDYRYVLYITELITDDISYMTRYEAYCPLFMAYVYDYV